MNVVLKRAYGESFVPDYRLVVTYNVTAENEAEVVRQFSTDRAAHSDGWLTKVERIDEQP